jgi:Tol biopolymer transport system component
VHDRQLGVTSLVSKDTGGNPVSGGAIIISPSINGDGRFVAYVSNATTIVSGVGGQQVYLYDRQTDVTSLVSRDSAGAINPGNLVSSTPSINFDGRFVAFVSNSTNLVTGVSVAPQIYLRDVQIGATSLVSKDSSGNPISGGSTIISPTISGDGSFVAYVSDMPNIVPGVGGQQVYLYNGQTDVTSLVSEDNSLTPQEGNGPSSAPSISNDGCFVAFASQSSNLGSSANQIYIRGPLAVAGCAGPELTTLVSKDDGGSPATSVVGATIDPSVNGNGEFVAFSSTATDLISPAPSGNRQIYVRALP